MLSRSGNKRIRSNDEEQEAAVPSPDRREEVLLNGSTTPNNTHQHHSIIPAANPNFVRAIPARLTITLPALPRIATALVKRVIPILELLPSPYVRNGEDNNSTKAPTSSSTSVIGSELIWDSAGLRVALARSLLYEIIQIKKEEAEKGGKITRTIINGRNDQEAILKVVEHLASIVEREKVRILQGRIFDAENSFSVQASPLRVVAARSAGLIPSPIQDNNETVVAWDSGEITILHDKMGIEQEEFYRILLARTIAPMSSPSSSAATSTAIGKRTKASKQHHHPLVYTSKLEASAIGKCQMDRLLSHVSTTKDPIQQNNGGAPTSPTSLLSSSPSSSTSFGPSYFGGTASPSSELDRILIESSSFTSPISMWASLASTQCSKVFKCTWTRAAFGTPPSPHTRCGGAISDHNIEELNNLNKFLASLLPAAISNKTLGTNIDVTAAQIQHLRCMGKEEVLKWFKCAKDILKIISLISTLLHVGTSVPTTTSATSGGGVATEASTSTLGCLRFDIGRSSNYFDRRTTNLGTTVELTLIREVQRFIESGLNFHRVGGGSRKCSANDEAAYLVSEIVRECLNKVVRIRAAELQHAATAALTALSAEKARIMVEFFKGAHSNDSGGHYHNMGSGTAAVKKRGVKLTASISNSLLWVYTEPIVPNLIKGCHAVGLLRHSSPSAATSSLLSLYDDDDGDSFSSGNQRNWKALSGSIPLPGIIDTESDLLSQFGWEYLVRRIMEKHAMSAQYPGFKHMLRKTLKLPIYEGGRSVNSNNRIPGDDAHHRQGKSKGEGGELSAVDSIKRGPSGEIIIDTSMIYPPFSKAQSSSSSTPPPAFSVAELFYIAALGHRSSSPRGATSSSLHENPEPAAHSPLTPQEEQSVLKSMTSQTTSSTTTSSSGSCNNMGGGVVEKRGVASTSTFALGHLLSAIIATQRFIHKEKRTMNHSELTALLNEEQFRNRYCDISM